MKKNVLTPRELEVLDLLLYGYNNSKIAEKLCISTHTTKAHISSIYEKLNVTNRVQAIVKCLKENLLGKIREAEDNFER